MITNIRDIAQKIEEYKKKSYDNYLFHTRNARASNHWHSFFEIVGVVLTSGLALSTVVLTALQTENMTVAITSGCFSFLISVAQRIQNSYSFITLESKHHTLADNYYEVFWALDNMDINNINFHEFELIMNKYMLVSQKHTQPIKDCLIFCCFN